MANNSLELRDLRAQLDDLGQRFPALKNDDLFVLWFMAAYLTGSELLAQGALGGASGDQSVDAAHVDHDARIVTVIQGKYREQLMGKAEKRADVLTFAELAGKVAAQDGTLFAELLEHTEPLTANLLKKARQQVRRHKYRLDLHYVTLGRCSAGLRQQAEKTARVRDVPVRFKLFDGDDVLHLLRDYLDGVAPPIPELELEIEQTSGISVKGSLMRVDHNNDIQSYAISMRGDRVARIFEEAGPRLFARNIRGFLGERAEVNASMVETLKTEPSRFFYYNNGITILCDQAEFASGEKEVLRVTNPQVINGQQTTRVLAAHRDLAAKASVLVKVMKVPRDNAVGSEGFDDLLSRIVAGTNRQSAIGDADLMSNDRKQIELERELRKLNYVYIRKRESKREARQTHNGKCCLAIRKTDMAMAVAACELDPSVLRGGKDRLFDEELYDRVFPHSEARYYLNRFYLSEHVRWFAHEFHGGGRARYHVAHFMWGEMASVLSSPPASTAFRRLHERHMWDELGPLSEAVRTVYRVMVQFYWSASGKGAKRLEPTDFYKPKGRYTEFVQFWNSRHNTRRSLFRKRLAGAVEAIRSYEE